MMIYLASPYSHDEERIRIRRYIATREFTWHHLQMGVALFSPIVYCHQFARDFGAGIDAVTWLHLNEPMLSMAREVWVLELDGWRESAGVRWEMGFAKQLSIPVTMKEPLPHAPV